MLPRNLRFIWLLALVLTASFGCSRRSEPPTPLPAAELPTAIESAFGKAAPEVKVLSDQILAAIQAKDYSKAFLMMQTLTARPGLTKEQLNVTSRAMLTLNELMQSAVTQGDQKAAQTLQRYQLDK